MSCQGRLGPDYIELRRYKGIPASMYSLIQSHLAISIFVQFILDSHWWTCMIILTLVNTHTHSP